MYSRRKNSVIYCNYEKRKNHSSQPKSKFGTKPGLVEYNMTFVDENNVASEYILNLQTGKFQEVGTKKCITQITK